MKVILVNQYAHPPDWAGGSRHHVLARELTSMGHQVTIVTADFSHLTRGSGPDHPAFQLREGVRYAWIDSLSSEKNGVMRLLGMLDFSVRVALGRRTRRLGRPDLVIGSSPNPFAALGARRLARRFHVPFVLEVRDLWPDSLIDVAGFSSRHPLVRVLRLIERSLYRSARRTVTLLPHAAEVIEERGARAGTVVWVPNGVDLAEAGPFSGPKRSKQFTIMYAGAHGRANSLDTVIDAAKLLGSDQPTQLSGVSIRVLLMGDGPEKNRLMKRVARENVEFVEFLDPVARQNLYGVLRQADAFILPLVKAKVFQFGVSPNKLYDYLAIGRPIIIAVDSSNDPVGEAEAGRRVPAEDPVAMAAAIRQLAGLSDDEREAMGSRGRAFVEKNHDLAGLAVRLEEILLEALSF